MHIGHNDNISKASYTFLLRKKKEEHDEACANM